MAHVRWDPDVFPSPLLEEDAQPQPGPTAGWDSGEPEDRHIPKLETSMDRAEMQAEHSVYLDLGIGVERHMISVKPLPLNSNKNIVI